MSDFICPILSIVDHARTKCKENKCMFWVETACSLFWIGKFFQTIQDEIDSGFKGAD